MEVPIMMRSRLFVICLAAVFAGSLFAQQPAPPPAGDQPPVPARTVESDSANRLRAAGVEPTLEGIQKYLQALMGAEAQKGVAKLIADLGHDDFTIREKASRELAEIVPLPTAALQVAAKADDAERAWRAERLLKMARPQNAKTISAALDVIAAHKLAIGLPLLVRLYQHVDAADTKSEVLAAAIAIVTEADRATVETMAKEKDKTTQDIGRVLLARLDNKDLPHDLARNFDAVKVIPGNTASGGANLVAGWEFRTKADLTITHLGIFDRKPAGLNTAHEVAIWDLDDPNKPVVIETVPSGEKALLAGEFRIVPTPRIRLRADRQYAIVAHYPDTTDSTVSRVNPTGLTIEYAQHLEVLGRRYIFPQPAMAFPARAQAGMDHATIGPTFRYETLEVGK
jgi:hypothetical protein